jgi:hypothetical protein
MLTTDPRIQPALVKGHFEDLQRYQVIDGRAQGHTSSRFRAVVDGHGAELGAVSDRYKLVQTADIVSAFDIEAERLGFQVAPREGQYHNGRSKVILDVTNREIRRDGGDGTITPMVYIENGLGGVSKLRIGTGSNIARCTNGLWFGDIVSRDTRKHTSGLDLHAIVLNALEQLEERIDRDHHLIMAARATRFDFAGELTQKIGESAPKRLQDEFKSIITGNRRACGDNVWAMLQSITELSTHHMRETSKGRHVWSADEWTRRQVGRITEEYAL